MCCLELTHNYEVICDFRQDIAMANWSSDKKVIKGDAYNENILI